VTLLVDSFDAVNMFRLLVVCCIALFWLLVFGVYYADRDYALWVVDYYEEDECEQE